MKVLHVVHGYPPSIGGCQWLIKNLSEQLVSRYGDQVTVLTTTAYNMDQFWRPGAATMRSGAEMVDGVWIQRYHAFNRLGPLLRLLAHGARRLHLPYNEWLRTIYNGPIVPDMAQSVAASGADVILAAGFPHLHMFYALSGAHRANIPIVLLGAIHPADRWGFDREMIYRAIRRADAYIALTMFEREYLLRRGVDPERVPIHVIGLGVDAHAFRGIDGIEARQRHGWGDRPVVAMIAKQGPHKRFDLLIEAMQQVWTLRPDVQLLIAGARTQYSPQIETIVAHLPPEGRAHVTILDDFDESEKPSLLAAADLLVLPSSHESFGIVFLEAWASGRPVIGARVGAIPSVIEEGQDGLLFTYGDASDLARAILELLADRIQRARMGEAGRRKVLSNYTWDSVADRVRKVYQQAILHRRQSGRF